MHTHAIGITLALAIASGVAAAPAAAQDAKAAEVIAQTRKALGGKKLETLKSLSAEAAMDRNVGTMQMSTEVELLLEMPDKFLRTEQPRGMMSPPMTSGFNGDKAIMSGGGNMPVGGGGAVVFRMGPAGGGSQETVKPTPEQLAEMQRMSLRGARTEVSRFMLGWFGQAHPTLKARYTYAGEAESPDGKAHVIDVTDGEGFDARLFIDVNNHLPLMVTYKGRQPRVMTSGPMMARPAGQGAPGTGVVTSATGEQREVSEEERKKVMAEAARQLAEQPPVEFSLFFDDWREVDGVLFPHVMRRAVAGEVNEEWTFKKVKVNPSIDAARFSVEAK